uniref:Uncharacterized protein n=1 Tax=Rhizophora mucronata TaxID=61149 RepID=A0A2P2R2Q2_RHIMU
MVHTTNRPLVECYRAYENELDSHCRAINNIEKKKIETQNRFHNLLFVGFTVM